jgi:hypothetical protein
MDSNGGSSKWTAMAAQEPNERLFFMALYHVENKEHYQKYK